MMARQERARGMTSSRFRPRELAARRIAEAKAVGTLGFYANTNVELEERFVDGGWIVVGRRKARMPIGGGAADRWGWAGEKPHPLKAEGAAPRTILGERKRCCLK